MIDTCIYLAPSQEYCKAMTIDNLDNVLFTGTWGSGLSFGTMKLSPDTTTSIYDDIVNPIEFSLSQNYPNPFNPSTKISWQSPVSGWQTLKVFDVLGNEVSTLVDEYRPAGSYEVEFYVAHESFRASGVYFYQLKAGEYIGTKKMIILK